MSFMGAVDTFAFTGDYQSTGKTRGADGGLAGLFISSIGLSALAGLLYKMGITSLFGGYVFSFALLGLRWPARLLEVFVFFIALGHRDFTYFAMDLGGGASGEAKVFITEWVLLILVGTAVPGIWRMVKRLDAGIILLGVFLVTGSAMFIMTFGDWPPSTSLRDFALVYYSLFAIAVMVHARDFFGVRRIGVALVLGTIPNLAGEILNYLYGTLPVTAAQKNYSMRNSYYYLAALGALMPFVLREDGRPNMLPSIYCIAVYLTVLLYSYSKTAMIASVALTVLHFAPRLRTTRAPVLIVIAALFFFPLILTPPGKTFQFLSIFSEATYAQNSRTLLQVTAMLDFSEYPYGIGFGAPIFGEHSRQLVENVDSFQAVHNSYITLLRRIGIQGLLSFGGLLAGASYMAVKAYRFFPSGTWQKHVISGTANAVVACGIFLFAHVALEGPFMGSIFWCAVGCMFVAGHRELLIENPYASAVRRGER